MMKIRPVCSALKRAPASRSISALAPARAEDVAQSPPTIRKRPPGLPTTPAPTPYHPHVHLPLLSFAPPSTSNLTATPTRLLVPLPSPLFNAPARPSLLHKLVIAHLASLRAGNASTKNRSEVNYSGKKLRPQKGTGGARLGSRGSPMLRGGGRAFALTPKGPDGWARKVNRKEEQLGLRVGLSDKWRTGNLAIVDRIGLGETSTRKLRERLAAREWTDAVFVLAGKEGRESQEAEELDAFVRSSGNLPGVAVVEDPAELGIWEIVKSRKVIIELDAIDAVIRRLDPENRLAFETHELDEGEDFSLEEQEALALELEDALADEAVEALEANRQA